MAERDVVARLDEAIETILGGKDSAGAPAGSELAGLLAVAVELAELPDERFRARLAAELSGGTSKGVEMEKPREEQTVTPYIMVREPERLLAFVRDAFGAAELSRGTGGAGGLHAEVAIGDSKLMIGGMPTLPEEAPAAIHLQVDDVDAVHARALAAGAAEIEAPSDQPYGERVSALRDAMGNEWYPAKALPGFEAEWAELRAANLYLHPAGAGRLLDFLTAAFGAEVREAHRSPDGTVVHAKVRLGKSIVELGEAHDPYPPLPTAIFLNVPDTDAAFARAVAAGAAPLQPPTDQPYGLRTAALKDPFGHTWYPAAPIRGAKP